MDHESRIMNHESWIMNHGSWIRFENHFILPKVDHNIAPISSANFIDLLK